jgi:hypothetical protein
VNDEKILFEIELFVGYDHVANHTVKMAAQKAVDDLFSVYAKAFNLFKWGQVTGTCTVPRGF